MQNQTSGGQTGTPDPTYNLTAVLYHALQGVENCKTYEQDGGDQQIQQFFQQAGQVQKQLAEQAKVLLHDQLMQQVQGGQSGGQGGSAFSFSGDQQDGMSPREETTGSTGMGQTSGASSS